MTRLFRRVKGRFKCFVFDEHMTIPYRRCVCHWCGRSIC